MVINLFIFIIFIVMVKCPRCKQELSPDEVREMVSFAVAEGIVKAAGRQKGSKNSKVRSDKGVSHGPKRKETESDIKKLTSAENGKRGGRPKGSKNKAPRADIGKKRVNHEEQTQQQ